MPDIQALPPRVDRSLVHAGESGFIAFGDPTMWRISIVMIVALLAAQPAVAGSRKSVTLEIDADLLRRAESLNMDLGAFLEKRLATALGGGPP
jgi:hypothetical protein